MPRRTISHLENIIETQIMTISQRAKQRDDAITERDAAMKERDDAIKERDDAMNEQNSSTQELYMPTITRGLYITADPPALSTHIEVLHDLPDDEQELVWSSNWRSIQPENYQREDAVTVNMHGRFGTRLPGIFVAHEEVERPIRLWYFTEAGKAVVKIDNLGMERDGIEESYKSQTMSLNRLWTDSHRYRWIPGGKGKRDVDKKEEARKKDDKRKGNEKAEKLKRGVDEKQKVDKADKEAKKKAKKNEEGEALAKIFEDELGLSRRR
ncbi:hypothetical protein J4E86_010970 [Alternaria arbusti]|uniref:uncharacterized protein n=1 Tax=Alternaria arbusti TaxID=232088 RepID=UPI00221E50C8|nr:uncharacterized protein J4E86_010970 [Alternaria arbusti]KAI4940336.1 hypothetical protein J4E86_010970 [Alternaria arbusti]